MKLRGSLTAVSIKYSVLSILAVVFAAVLLLPSSASAVFGDTTAHVGTTKAGDGDHRTEAYLDFPAGIASDGAGNFYIADTQNHVIRKVSSNGTVSTAVGSGSFGDTNDTGAKTKFAYPEDVTVDASGNIYVADTGNGKIKKFNGGKTTTLRSGLGSPTGIFLRNNTLYFTDSVNGRLHSISTSGTNFTTITSSLTNPKKLYVRTGEDYAYVANAGDYTVARVKLSGGHVTTVLGTSGSAGSSTGTCSESKFKSLSGITVEEGSSLSADDIYLTDGTGVPTAGETNRVTSDLGRVKYVDLDGSSNANECTVVKIMEDTDEFNFNFATDIVLYGSDLYIVATGTGEIVKLDKYTRDDQLAEPILWAGKNRFHDKDGKKGLPGRPKDLAIKKNGKKIYFSENNQIKSMSIKGKNIKSIVGNVRDNYQVTDTQAYYGDSGRFSDPIAIALNPKDENILYVVDRNNNRIREVNINKGSVSYLTGAGDVNVEGDYPAVYQNGGACEDEFEYEDKAEGCAYFSRPTGIAVDKNGKFAYVSDAGNHVIRRVRLTGENKGKTKLIAGKPGKAGFGNGKKKDRFNVPMGLSIDGKSKFLYVADRNNNAIRKVNVRNGKVTTVTGKPSKQGYLDGKVKEAQLNLPVEVFHQKGDIFFSEAGTNMIRVVDGSDNNVKLVSGDGNRGYTNGKRKNAMWDNPAGIVRKKKNLFVSDTNNDVIRKVKVGSVLKFTEPGPGVSQVNPTSNKVAGSVSDVKALQVLGDEFRHGATAYFGNHKANQTFVNSETELSVVIPFGEMAPGYYQIRVENTDGQSGCALRGYSISDTNDIVPETDYWSDGC